MRRLIFIIVFGVFCAFLAGCHTLNTLSRVHTGHIDLRDICDSVIADDRDFQNTLW